MTNSDNRQVMRGRQSCEYLCIGENEDLAERVFLYRYFVPGRCDVYGFGLQLAQPGRTRRLAYWSESDIPMARALTALMKDLEKPAVVSMFSRFATTSSHHVTVLQFLELLAPKSSAVRAYRKACRARLKRWRAMRELRKAAGR